MNQSKRAKPGVNGPAHAEHHIPTGLTKEEAIALAKAIVGDEPDMKRVRPIPTPNGWLLECRVGLFKFVVRSRAELDAALHIVLGDPDAAAIIEAYEDRIRALVIGRSLRPGMDADDILQIVSSKAVAGDVKTIEELLAIATETIELSMGGRS